MKKLLNVLAVLVTIALLGGCITIVQPTPAPKEAPTQMPTETQAPTTPTTPTIVPTPTAEPTEAQGSDYEAFAERFTKWYGIAQPQMPNLAGVDLVGAEFLPDGDGTMWLTIGFVGTTEDDETASDYYMLGVVTGLIKAVIDEGYKLEREPFGVMVIFFTNPAERKARCGAIVDWSAMVDFANGEITPEDLIYHWIYPVLPESSVQGSL